MAADPCCNIVVKFTSDIDNLVWKAKVRMLSGYCTEKRSRNFGCSNMFKE
jgi:hypothetical protein